MNNVVVFNTEEDGLRTVKKDYQETALRYLWGLENVGASSREVWVNVNVALIGQKTISRASIINSLNDMVDEGMLTFHEVTGKGGHRRIYAAKYDEAGTNLYLAKKFILRMLEVWPEATQETINSLTS